MSKGIIVVDVPAGCYECECSITKEYQNSMSGEHYCGITERKVSKYWSHEPSLKPYWCPINPMPEKKNEHNTTYDSEYFYVHGWNDCL